MPFRRAAKLGLVDLGITVVVAVAVFLPPREMYASNAIKGDADAQFALALAEARTIARPGDGAAVEAFARRLGEAAQKDWAIDAAVAAAAHGNDSPTRWRALAAASAAYVDRLDVQPGLEYANQAVAACLRAGDACPAAEEVRLELYQQNLEAGVKSGIDPRHDPKGFRKASESALREIHLGGAPTGETPTSSGSAAPGGSASSP